MTENQNNRVSGLAMHWGFFHPILRTNLDSLRGAGGLVNKKSHDLISWLPIYYNPHKGNPINVEGTVAGMCPRLVTVNDMGIFQAIYDDDEVIAIMGDMEHFVRSTTPIHYENTNWDVPVYEEFGFLPACVVVSRSMKCVFFPELPSETYLETLVLESDKSVASHPYPVYREIRKQLSLPAPTTPAPAYGDPDYEEYWTKRGVWRLAPTVGPHKNTCAYDSTKDFLEHLLGISLHHSDREWYIGDNRVVADGLPMELTLEVLTELVAPYGIEIDRVWVMDGNWKDEFNTFANPAGIDNEIYRMAREIDPSIPEPRVFIGPVPDGIPVIVMAKSLTSAMPGGHASYLGPRSIRPTDVIMALTYRRKGL